MGRHHKDDGDDAPATKYPGHDYEQTGGGKHAPKPDRTSGHLGKRGDNDGKSSPDGWGGDRSKQS